MKRFLLSLGLILVAVAGWAAPAFGHAQLQSTEPAGSQVLSRSPGTIVCHFDEPVEVSFGALRVFDKDAKRLDSGQAVHPHGDSHAVATTISGTLPTGGYVVTWRVISDDGHPVHGAFTFRIGAGTATDAATTQAEAARLLAAGGGSHTVGVLFGVVRFAGFVGLAMLVGGTAFVTANWRDGLDHRIVRRLLWAALATTAVTSALAVALQGPYGGGLGLSRAVKPAVIRAVLHTRFGQVYAARLGILAVAAVLLWTLFKRSVTSRWWPPAAILTAAGLLITPGLAGHPSTGRLVALAVPFDLVHLAAVSVWVGGLAMLAAAAFNNDTEPRVVARFSQWAMVSVVAIAISGGFAAWRQVGSVRAVTTTPYGRLVLYKTILFAVVLAVASVSRRLVHGDLALPAAITRRHQRSREPATALSPGPGAQARRAPAPTQARRGRAQGTAQAPGQLKRAVLIELALVGVVLALAAVLVNVQPARAAASGPFSSEAAAGNDLLVDVVVDPARAGPVAFHLYTLTASGAQTDPPAVDATLTLPRPGIDNLKVPFEKAGPGHWISVGFDVPIRGRWTLQVNVRTTNVDMVAAQPIVVPIR